MDIKDFIIAQSAGNLYWKDKDCKYLGCNKNFSIICGLSSPADIIGKTDHDLFSNFLGEIDIKNLLEVDKTVLYEGKTIVCEETGINEKKERAIFLTKKAPLIDYRNNIIGIIGTSIDITKEKQAEVLKTEFIQNMQHDMRTPAVGLWGVLNILATSEEDTHKKEALDMAVEASKRLLDLCNETVEFGDLSGNTRPVIQNNLDVRALAQSVIELNKPAAFAKDLVIHLKVATSVPPHIASDEYRLSRILINLMGNAIKFSHEGEITLSMTASIEEGEIRKGLLTIELKDMGIGIAPNKINHIFEKFSRGVASNTNLYPGTGLGLYVVKTFVDELGGDINVQSRENEGTYFKLNIPFKALLEDMKKPGVEINEHFRSPIQAEVVGTKQNTTATVQKRSVANTPFSHELLIVEDDKTCLFAEKSLLSCFTNHIDTAENVAEALEKLATKRYDLVISDLGLPDGSGNDIVAKIKATSESPNYKTPFVAMTAHQDALKHQQAMDAGFTATHTKPLGAEKATELLNTYLVERAASPPKKEQGLPVIDLALGMKRTASVNESGIIELLGILWESLQVDIPILKQAEENNDLLGVNAILLKISGGLSYSGTPRLEAACDVLYTMTESGIKNLAQIENLFSAFYDEAALFAEQFKELIKSVNAQNNHSSF
ncbi:MAG: putative sensory histidine-kinase / response regulator [Gammaproteobacteria bacterium]|jgi:signal transduction histidine kinase/CheY-like chemotaxis protein|nr:putative sensory histidine-kinase / response regulator [Gammaproteobacteria bacterium]